MENEHGALILKQVGEPMPLVKARLHNGLDLTVKEVKSVLSAHGVVLPGAPSKSDCYAKLMELHAENDLQMQEFLQKSKVKLNQGDLEEEDRVSEYEELLGMIEEDDINRNDPDVKQEKEKLKRRRLQKPKVPEGHITLEPKRGRGRGRGKGRGRAKAGPKATLLKMVATCH